MNTFQIKVIALLAMTLDHIAYFFLGETPLALTFHWIGRISAPLFIFCVVNGMKYTRSKRKYILRLYLAGIAMAVFQMLSQTELNFFRTLFIIAVLIAVLEMREHFHPGRRHRLCPYRHHILLVFRGKETLIRRICRLHPGIHLQYGNLCDTGGP